MKKTLTFVMILSMVLASAIAYAESTHEGGRGVWKKTCRIACHDGNTDGSPVISPDSKTQMQWENNFADKRAYIMKFHQAGEIKKLSEKQWAAIYDFVYHHAHDSDNPEDCMGNEGAMVR
jgi:cytochrome c5